MCNKNNPKSLPLGDEEERPVGNFVNPRAVNPRAGRDDAQTEQSSLTNNSGALKCPPPPSCLRWPGSCNFFF